LFAEQGRTSIDFDELAQLARQITSERRLG
jgi:hypothetical protein